MASRTTNNWSDGRTDGRTDDAAFSSAAAACSAIRVANKATERRKGTKAEKEKERGANAASETATALRCAAAAIGVRFSERLMCRKENLSDVFPSISFPSYFYNGLTVSQENFKANFLKLKSTRVGCGLWSGESGTSSKYN